MTPEQEVRLRPCPFDGGAADESERPGSEDYYYGHDAFVQIDCSTCSARVKVHEGVAVTDELRARA